MATHALTNLVALADDDIYILPPTANLRSLRPTTQLVWAVRGCDNGTAIGQVLRSEAGLPLRMGVEVDRIMGPLRRVRPLRPTLTRTSQVLAGGRR